MKPFVVYIDKSKVGKGKIVLEVEEFEKIIEEAYNEGYNDGLNKNISTPITPYPTWTPDPITNPPNWYTTTPKPYWWDQPYCTTASTKDNADNVVISAWNDKDTVASSSVTYAGHTGDDSWITIDASGTFGDITNDTICVNNTKSSI